jgi:UDP-N-acetyl-D-mannosaminuronic acid transferase (WecB/TagA/CpsF family)
MLRNGLAAGKRDILQRVHISKARRISTKCGPPSDGGIMTFTIEAFPALERPLPLRRPLRHLSSVKLGLPSANELAKLFDEFLDSREIATIGSCRAQELWRARKDFQLRKLLQSVDLVVPRGSALNLFVAGPLAAAGKAEQPQWLPDVLLRAGQRRECRAYFLGGRGCDPFDWARRAAIRNPGLRIAGASPAGVDFRDAEGCRRLVSAINGSGADILIVLPDDHRGEHFSLCYRSELEPPLMLVLWGGPPQLWTRRAGWPPGLASCRARVARKARVALARA